ncbi:palmitoyltransferase ZDHHC22-like [Mercenaria mercenaria]|uniref:palmitoyltransferase ZDHHC22-like n=1 Tax=Mercenaria mercenaria TaxID=6596 RepID=UPI00234F53BF|nr:palmitoyltransferase ZDHHC22-like [Mercenaria mercenaria]
MELRERNKPEESLKEKLRAKWHTRDFTPKEHHSNIFGMNFFFISSISLLIESLFFLVPRVFPETRWIMSLVTFIMFCETLLNWHRSYFDTANYVKSETKEKYFPDTDETPAGWKSCFKCQVDVPPRAHHCKHCGKCMLKRVHHCFLTGSCIGFHNQKFFIMFCLWSAISLGFCVKLQLSYLHVDLPLNSLEIFTYLPPVTLVKYVLGYISLGQTFIALHFFITAATFITSVLAFLWHLFLLLEGVTMYEGFKGIYGYAGTRAENIRSVFGSFLYIPVLIFLPYRFDQSMNGIQWKLRSKRVKGN